MEGLGVSKLEEGQQWGKNTSSRGLGSMGKKTPFYRTSRIQPLCAQVVHKRYYRLARSKQPNERENTSFWSRAEVATEVAAVVLLQAVVPLSRAVVPLPRAVVKNYFRSYPR